MILCFLPVVVRNVKNHLFLCELSSSYRPKQRRGNCLRMFHEIYFSWNSCLQTFTPTHLNFQWLYFILVMKILILRCNCSLTIVLRNIQYFKDFFFFYVNKRRYTDRQVVVRRQPKHILPTRRPAECNSNWPHVIVGVVQDLPRVSVVVAEEHSPYRRLEPKDDDVSYF